MDIDQINYEEEHDLMLRLRHRLGHMPQVDLPLLLEEHRHTIKLLRPDTGSDGWVLETLAGNIQHGGTIRACVYRLLLEGGES